MFSYLTMKPHLECGMLMPLGMTRTAGESLESIPGYGSLIPLDASRIW